ncbi:MAG: thermonuclease family protein [Candidatus Aenigmarchaeota archaeon]|nr:thermonuclease family protein [Candidatus Aenigmarchaeota archaeon]MDW8149709.1 thermonuclease family protein [Candidatus Aenigmarchaeota archaeon]
MKKLEIPYELKAFILSFLITLLIFLAIGKMKNRAETYRVIKILDGDTIILENGEKVRLIGIDAPEKNEKCYASAKSFLEEILKDKNITLEKEWKERDNYNRLLRHVYLDGTYINLMMIKYGLATYYPTQSKYSKILLEGEKKAKEMRIGCLWENFNETS